MSHASMWSRIGTAALVFLHFACPAAAERRTPLDVETLTRHASVILEGEVRSVDSAWNPERTRIYTTVRIDVREGHKGTLQGSTIELRLLGGTVGNVTMAVLGQARFRAGERTFLFLRPNFEVRDVPVVGLSQGKFELTRDARTNEETIASPMLVELKATVVETIQRLERRGR